MSPRQSTPNQSSEHTQPRSVQGKPLQSAVEVHGGRAPGSGEGHDVGMSPLCLDGTPVEVSTMMRRCTTGGYSLPRASVNVKLRS